MKFCGNRLDEDSLQIFTAVENELNFAEYISFCHPLAKTYYDHVAKGSSLPAKEGKYVINMLRFLIYFACGRQNELDQSENPMELQGKPDPRHQRMLREGKVIDALFLMLSAPRKGKLALDMLKHDHPQLEIIHNLTLKAIKFSFLGNERNELYLADRCLQNWNYSDDNETYMKMLIHSLQSHEEAAVVYQELVSNNKELLEKKINQDDVAIFMRLLMKRGPIPQFLQFLTAICACKGEPLVHNQELMLKEIYSASLQTNSAEQNRFKLLIETIIDPREATIAFDRQLAVPSVPLDPSTVLGGRILDDGFRNLLVGWYGSKEWKEDIAEPAFFFDPSSLGLKTVTVEQDLLPLELQKYQKKVNMKETGRAFQWVRIRDVMWTLQPDVMKRKADDGKEDAQGWTDYENEMKTNEAKRRRFKFTEQLAKYYVAQIELYATMCFDRSYNCIGHLQSQFTYELVVTAIADTSLPDRLRSAFANLIYVLYVDRYPQETLRIPNLVRTKADIKAVRLNDTDALPRFQFVSETSLTSRQPSIVDSVEKANASPTKFYILQETIAEHMNVKLKGFNVLFLRELNTLTLHMLQCLEKLFFSGFYSTYKQMKSFVEAAVKLLDGRNDVQQVKELFDKGIHFMDRRGTADVDHFGRGTVLNKATLTSIKGANIAHMGKSIWKLGSKQKPEVDNGLGVELSDVNFSNPVWNPDYPVHPTPLPPPLANGV
jgi:hypothetical protein